LDIRCLTDIKNDVVMFVNCSE